MDTVTKMAAIGQQMHLELAEEVNPRAALANRQVAPCGVPLDTSRPANTPEVFHAKMPGGKTIPLLKTMITTACERNCYYCPFRAGRSYRRITVSPDELARTFMQMHQARLVDGMFLSSGIIKGGLTTQDKIIDTADLLRNRYGFRGYLHLKVMPGADADQIARAAQLADRLSVNLEAPNTARLARLAPMKQFIEELLRPLRIVESLRHSAAGPRGKGYVSRRWPSTTTQFVVGAAGDSDVELLQTTHYLYRKLRLQRAYFMAFNPVRDTPLENSPAVDRRRESRLYQASFLLRDYGFLFEELPFDEQGLLPLDVDPKQGWAERHLRHAPVELNRAYRSELLRVPGIGPGTASRILSARRRGRLRSLHDLRALGIRTGRLAPYVLLDGRRPVRQLPLF